VVKLRDGERSLLRLVEVLKQRLAADDARLEIGGAPPITTDDRVALWSEIPGTSFRAVVMFRSEPPDRETKQARLRAMAEAFRGVVITALVGEAPTAEPPKRAPSLQLDEALANLAAATGATSAAVVDSASPVLWGRSHAELEVAPRDECAAALTRLGGLIAAAGDLQEVIAADHERRMTLLSAALQTRDARDEALLETLSRSPDAFAIIARSARAIELVRKQLATRVQTARLPLPRLLVQDHSHALFARGLADVYGLVLAFAGPLAEPTVDGAVRRAAPHLERLVETIPPWEPTPRRGARVIALKKR
jgi:hypothetical protein